MFLNAVGHIGSFSDRSLKPSVIKVDPLFLI